MTTKITRINQISKEKPKEIFTSIYHLINYELLKECFDELDGNKAVGIDMITKDKYYANLDKNLNNLVDKLKTKSYRPSPARKVNIPKANGKLIGHYNYYGITDNIRSLVNFKCAIGKVLYKWLNRRSQKRSYNWDKFTQMLKRYPLAEPKIKVNIYDI